MDIEAIREKVMALPIKTLGTEAKDEEVWEGEDHGAKFIVTREKLPLQRINLSVLSLSLSGDNEGVRQLTSDFIEAIGEPATTDTDPALPGIVFHAWLAEGVEHRLKI